MKAHWAVPLLLYFLIAVPRIAAQTPVKSDSLVSYSRVADGVEFQLHHGILTVRLCTDSLVHVTFRTPDGLNQPEPWIVKTNWPRVAFQVAEDANRNIVITTSRLRIVAERDSGALVFEDANGKVLVRESASPTPRDLTPEVVDAEHTFRASAYFDLTQDEMLLRAGPAPVRFAQHAWH